MSLQVERRAYRQIRACRGVPTAAGQLILGYPFLSGFNAAYDYPDGEVVLSPRKH